MSIGRHLEPPSSGPAKPLMSTVRTTRSHMGNSACCELNERPASVSVTVGGGLAESPSMHGSAAAAALSTRMARSVVKSSAGVSTPWSLSATAPRETDSPAWRSSERSDDVSAGMNDTSLYAMS